MSKVIWVFLALHSSNVISMNKSVDLGQAQILSSQFPTAPNSSEIASVKADDMYYSASEKFDASNVQNSNVAYQKKEICDELALLVVASYQFKDPRWIKTTKEWKNKVAQSISFKDGLYLVYPSFLTFYQQEQLIDSEQKLILYLGMNSVEKTKRDLLEDALGFLASIYRAETLFD